MSDYVLGATSPPTDRGRPLTAALLGLGLGPLGVAFATDTRIDPLLTGTAYLALSLKWGGWGMTFGLLLCAGYNVARVLYRNAQAEAAERAEARRAAEAMATPSRLLSAPEVIEAVTLPPVAMAEASAPAERIAVGFAILENPPRRVTLYAPLEPRPVAVDEPAAPEVRPEPLAPVPVELPPAAPEPVAADEPPAPPVPPAPRKRGRPKGSRKLAA